MSYGWKCENLQKFPHCWDKTVEFIFNNFQYTVEKGVEYNMLIYKITNKVNNKSYIG